MGRSSTGNGTATTSRARRLHSSLSGPPLDLLSSQGAEMAICPSQDEQCHPVQGSGSNNSLSVSKVMQHLLDHCELQQVAMVSGARPGASHIGPAKGPTPTGQRSFCEDLDIVGDIPQLHPLMEAPDPRCTTRWVADIISGSDMMLPAGTEAADHRRWVRCNIASTHSSDRRAVMVCESKSSPRSSISLMPTDFLGTKKYREKKPVHASEWGTTEMVHFWNSAALTSSKAALSQQGWREA
eukprot:superscaffoldBa00006952_g22072